MGARPSHGCVLTILLLGCSRRTPELAPAAPAQDEQSAFGPLVVDAVGVPSGLREFHAADFALEGSWKWNWLPAYDRTALSVRRTAASSYELEFLRSTDFGFFEHRTRAT